MASVSKTIIVGHVGKDPEVRALPNSETRVASFSVATTYKPKGKPDETEWHNIVAFGALAEVVSNYVTKGSKLYVEGRLRTRSWEDKDGVKHYKTEIVANELQLLDSKPKDDVRNDYESPRRATVPVPARIDDGDDIPF